jgi:hypothetical protein
LSGVRHLLACVRVARYNIGRDRQEVSVGPKNDVGNLALNTSTLRQAPHLVEASLGASDLQPGTIHRESET